MRTAVQNPDRQRIPSGPPVNANKAEIKESVDPRSLDFFYVDPGTNGSSTSALVIKEMKTNIFTIAFTGVPK